MASQDDPPLPPTRLASVRNGGASGTSPSSSSSSSEKKKGMGLFKNKGQFYQTWCSWQYWCALHSLLKTKSLIAITIIMS